MTQEQVLQRVNDKLECFGRLLFLTKSGSHLYGTNTPTSDEDYVGVFLAKPKYHLGFKTVNEVDCSIVDKDASGKNTHDAVDIKVYELKTFLKLAADSNPNIVELLFSTGDAVIFNTLEFKEFQNNYNLFINERVRHSFTGYARQQFKKGIQKADNFKKLNELIDVLENYDDNEMLAVVVENEPLLKTLDKGKHIEIAGLSFQKNLFVKKVKKQMKEKIKMASHRASMWEKYGYDTKFFMHLFRLLNEGKDLLLTGKLEFPVREKEFLLDVRNGKFTLEELQNLAEERFNEFNQLESVLPKKANWNKLENMFMDLLKNEFCVKES